MNAVSRERSAEQRPRPRKRGRPTAAVAAAISQAILSAATRLFLAQGYEGTTMEAIAAAAGVPKSTLYKRHGDKMALLRTVVQGRLAAWSAIASQARPALPTNLEQRLQRRVEIVLAWAASEEVQALGRLATGHGRGARDIARLVHEAGYQRMISNLEEEIIQFSGSDPAPVRDPKSIASALMALIAGWLVTMRPGAIPTREEATAMARRSVELLYHGRQRW